MKIEGRTFVVSGGASGLGKATVEIIAKNGGNVAILDMNDDAGAELVAALPDGSAKFFNCDVLETDSIASAVKGSVEWAEKSGKPLGGVIPAAGVGNPGTILDRHGEAVSMDSVDFVINVNLRGTIDLVRQCLVHIAKTEPQGEDGERGVVIMVASSAATEGQRGQLAYAASKGAVAAMTLPMARDLSVYGIRVVTIAPSLFDSRMTSFMSPKVRASLERSMEFPKRPGKPEEFAQLVQQSIENIMLNGTVLKLDGGMRMPSKL
ncbi:short chain dehydrogenase [Microdochium trichocladiopsis]|uniref:Short chain dehydrogenase n=1 Tax=Microdochium trichocladiopsis TaxID=1682393 RepID=A0A9P8YB39_9PEZI|nr:short chain dehydrogenase [Microdochium trichocladiopsis]KAH7034705.1 short chain dehydrogenase [Microdochium trichocladiopsis]